MSSPTQRPSVDTVRDLLHAAGWPVGTLAPVEGGRVSWTYVADDEAIVQLPRFDQAVEALRTQSVLMPLVQATVPFAVPVPAPVASYQGRPVMRYRMVPGRPLRLGDRWRDIPAMLHALHRVPADQAADILCCEPTAEAWRSRYAEFRSAVTDALFPHLSEDVAAAISTQYERFLSGPFDFTPVFVHSDLDAEHILVDPQTGQPSGLIDFDWASVGDPALDFVGLLTALGPQVTHRLISAYGTVAWSRLLFYWWLNPCYELVYAGSYLDEHALARGIQTIRARLARLSELQRSPPR